MSDKTEPPIVQILSARDDAARPQLARIGQQIGYGNAQHILGQLWDEMLTEAYGVPPGRGQMGVTVDDRLPPLPRSRALRRQQRPDGGYDMVPAYTADDMRAFAHAAIAKATGASNA